MRLHKRLGFILLILGSSIAGLAQDLGYAQALQNFREGPRTEESLQTTIQARQQETGEDATIAQLTVLRDIADIEAAEERWSDARGHSIAALEIARRLEDADLIFYHGLRTAQFDFLKGARGEAAILSRELAAMAEALDRLPELEEAWMILAKVHQVSGGRAKADEFFERILNLPSRDPFAVLKQQAWGLNGPKYHDALENMWSRALKFAEDDDNTTRQITAHQNLAELAFDRNDHPTAQSHLDHIAKLRTDHPEARAAWQWLAAAQLQITQNRIDEAMDSIRHGIAQAETDNDPDSRIGLLAELAKLQAETDPAVAFKTLATAYQERIAIGRNQQTIKATTLAVANTDEHLNEISELTAVRNALRDAELARTQARNQQIAATAIAIALLAALLALAFLLKRRTAANATLQAENAQLEALRYQLNPHFLFNSLANLNGLILTSPDRARQTIRRLSDFCRLALTRQESPLLTVKDEAARLQAYLDVALAAEEADLQANLIVDPAAEGQALPPLLIQPLIENALKYSEPNSADQRIVTSHISAPNPKILRIEVSNTGAWERRAPARPSTGVGLNNLRERLARYYPHRHELTFEKTPTQVTATLTLHQE